MVKFYRIKPMGLKEWYKKKRGKKKWILNKNEVEEPRFQMNKFKLEKERTFLILEEWGAGGLVEKDLLFLL
jgi:hypothetical protein